MCIQSKPQALSRFNLEYIPIKIFLPSVGLKSKAGLDLSNNFIFSFHSKSAIYLKQPLIFVTLRVLMKFLVYFVRFEKHSIFVMKSIVLVSNIFMAVVWTKSGFTKYFNSFHGFSSSSRVEGTSKSSNLVKMI